VGIVLRLQSKKTFWASLNDSASASASVKAESVPV
jgi:hypothetical protein